MKKINLMIMAFCSIVSTMAIASSDPTYRYEVTLPEAQNPLEIKVRRGEQKTTVVDGKSIEYTRDVTRISAQAWTKMVDAGTAPRHDFVTCNSKTCSYGNKADIKDQTVITLRLDEKDGVLITTSFYSNSTSGFKGKYPVPDISTTTAMQKKELSVGDTLVVLQDKTRGDVKVKLIAIEQ